MKRMFAIPALLALYGIASANPNITTNFQNRFVGIEGPVHIDNPVAQTTVSINGEETTAYLWLNYDIDGERIAEMDVSAKRSFAMGPFSLDAGVEYWIYPPDFSADLAAVLSFDYSGPVNANLTAKKQVNKGLDEGYIGVLSVSRPFGLGSLTVTPNASTVYRNEFFGGTGMPYVRAGIALSARLLGFNVGTTYTHQALLDDALADDTDILALSVSR